jgi:hypothetical protein
MRTRLFASTMLWLAALVFTPYLWADPPAVKPEEPAPNAAAREKAEPEKAEEPAKPKEPASKFLRIRKDDKGELLALETSVVRYVPADEKSPPISVDLVGAVHVGDKSYYDELNKLFLDYDALLYELVAPEGTRIPKEGRKGGGNPVSALQVGMKSMLELEFQLEQVDYTKENFVHADMSPEEFAKSMERRGESFLQIIFKAIAQGSAQNNASAPSDVELLFALFAKDRPLRLKRILAAQFENMEIAMAAFNGPDGSTIITERNKKAFEVLAREIKAGKKKIGVFYGAGHLDDMEQRLLADFGLKRESERWIPAWSLVRPAPKARPVEPAPQAEPAASEAKASG